MNTHQSESVTATRTATRTVTLILVLSGCAAALITHLATLHTSGVDPFSSPIGALAHSENATWFRNGLWLFGLGHLGLIVLLNRPGAGRFTRAAQCFILLNALIIFWLPWHFASVTHAELKSATGAGPLWLLGGTVGFAMTFVAGALWRSHHSTAFLTLVCLLLWSLLAPIFLTIDADSIGAYQRCVGALLLFWSATVAVRIAKPTRI